MKRFSLAILLLCLAGLTACDTFENLFGKESGRRGALPGTRQDVFGNEAMLKADPTVAATPVDLPAPVDNADWALPGGSATGVNGNLALSATPNEAWSVSIGAGASDENPLIATPVVAGGKIFALDAEAVATAYNAADGSRLWQQSVPAEKREDTTVSGSGLAYAQGKLIVTTSYGDVAALDATTGKILWSRLLPNPVRAPATIVEDRVYVNSANNVLYELMLADGTLGWTHSGITEPASFLGMAAPVADGDLLIVPFSSGEITGLRRVNGRTVWEENLASTQKTGTLPSMADIQGQPIVDGNRVYAASHAGRLIALDARAGLRAWEADVGGNETPYLAGESLYLLTTENQLTALTRDSGRVRWAVNLAQFEDDADKTTPIIWSGPVMAGGRLWLTSSRGALKSYSPTDGKELSSNDLGAAYLPPIVAGHTLYVLTQDGTLHAFR